MVLFCFQDDLQDIVNPILYTGKWLTHAHVASR